MDARAFWTALAVQALVLAVPFALLGLALPDDFFENWGFLVGPALWLACSLVSARALRLPLSFVLFAALAGGVAGAIAFAIASHWAGIVAALLVFAASCASFAVAETEVAAGHPSGD